MLKRLVKKSLSKNLILPLKKGKRIIFIYHDISNPDSLQYSKNYSTSIEKFKEQIRFLSDKFEWVDLDTINRSEPFEKNVASLVFDDGFKSVQTNAAPFLREKNIPFSIFVSQCAIQYNRLWVSDLKFNLDQLEEEFGAEFKNDLRSKNAGELLLKNRSFQNKLNTSIHTEFKKEQIYLGAEDLARLHKQGVLIGNHGSTHANLHFCNEKSLELEIAGNKTFIEKIINAPVKHYAIAFGKKQHYTSKALDFINSSGHTFIYSSNPVSIGKNFKDPLIPRIGLTDQSPEEIMFYINRQFLKKVDL